MKEWYELVSKPQVNFTADSLLFCLSNHIGRRNREQITLDLSQIASQFGFEMANQTIDKYHLSQLGIKKKAMG
jgi:hypothetical protein